MSITTMTFFEYWKLAIEAMLYIGACAFLLRILWLIVTVHEPRTMWEPKQRSGQDH